MNCIKDILVLPGHDISKVPCSQATHSGAWNLYSLV